jgi:spore coat protein H
MEVHTRRPVAIAVAAGLVVATVLTTAVMQADDVRGRDAVPDYPRVFVQERVARLDVRISATDWQAVVSDMEQMLGPFGSGGAAAGGRGGGPANQEAIAACAGLAEGSACTIGTPPVSGRCALTPNGGRSASCIPVNEVPGGGGVDEDGVLPRTPLYIPAEIAFDGETFRNVGFRLKGRSNLLNSWVRGIGKLPFRLNLDALKSRFPETRDQTFFGFPNLGFDNHQQDSSYLHDKIANDLFREAGVPAPETAFVRVFVDRGAGPFYLGLYTMVEVPDTPMLERFFGSDDGNLYKPRGMGAWIAFVKDNFPKRSNEADEDWTDVADAIAALHAARDNPALWRSRLEARLDVNAFLRWLALNTILGNADAYTPGNGYLYGSPRHRDRLFWIPWDNDTALQSDSTRVVGDEIPAPGGGRPAITLDLFHDRVGSDKPLVRFLMDDALYRATYRAHVAELVATVFDPARLSATIRSEHARIARYVVGDEGEDPSRSFAGTPIEFDATVYGPNGLVAYVEARAAAVRQALQGR